MRSEKLKNEIRKLDVTEKLLLGEEVWNEIASSNEGLPLPECQKKGLSRQLGGYDQGEIESTAWQQVHEDLKNSYK